MTQGPQQSKLRLKDRRQRLMWVKVGAGSAVVALALVLVWNVARLPSVTIADIEVSGVAPEESEVVEGIAASELAGSYFFFVPRANALVFPKENITAALTNAFPGIAEVSVARDGWNRLVIALAPREPAALWCPSENAETQTCFFMDKNGFVFGKASTGAPYIRFSGSISGDPIGKTYVSGFASLKSFVEEVSATIRRSPGSVLVDENGDVSLTFKEGGVLMFVLFTDRPALLENIASVFASRELGNGRELEYADFRFGDKVYVKFVEE